MTTKIAYAPKIRRHVEMPSHYDPSIVSRCDLAHDAALTRVDPGDEVVAYDGDEGYIVSLDGDTITVAWDTGVTTTGPLDGIALV